MRYTHYGVGHPTVLREIARDCANADLADSPESEEDENDGDGDWNWESDIRPFHGEDGDDDEGGEDDDDDEEEDKELDYDDAEESGVQNGLDDEAMEVGEVEDDSEDSEDEYMMSF